MMTEESIVSCSGIGSVAIILLLVSYVQQCALDDAFPLTSQVTPNVGYINFLHKANSEVNKLFHETSVQSITKSKSNLKPSL